MPQGRALRLGIGCLGVHAIGVALLGLALLLFAVAPAQGLFGDGLTISPDGVPASQPRIATDRANNAIAVWTAQDDAGNLRVQAAFRPDGGDFGPAQTLSQQGATAFDPQIVFDQHANAFVAWTAFPDSTGSEIQVSFRPKGGSFGAPVTVSEPATAGRESIGARIAVKESAMVVWTKNEADTSTVQASFRPKDGSFGSTSSVLAGGFDPDVAVDEQGNALVVAAGEDGRVFSAFKPRTGSFHVAQAISDVNGSTPRIAVDAGGDALAVWSTDNGGPIQTSFRAAGGSFGAPQAVSEEGGNPFEPQVAFDEQDNALVVWSRFDGGNLRVQSSTRPEGGEFDSPVTLSAPDQDAFEPRITAHEGAAVVWTRPDGANLRVQGAFRRPGEQFGTPQTLSEAGQDGFEPDVAMDQRDNALVLWTRNEFLDFPRVQFSFRARAGSFTEAQAVSPDTEGGFQAHVATDRWNNALAVWTADSDIGSSGNPTLVRAAFRPVGGEFGAPVTLSDPNNNAFQPQVAFERNGEAVVAWTTSDDQGSQRVQAAIRPAGSGFLSPSFVSPGGQDSFDPQVAAGRGAVVVWSTFDGANLRTQGSVKAEDMGFATSLDLSSAGEDANSPQVGVSEDGTAIATWFVNAGERVDAAVGNTATGQFGPATPLSGAGLGASQPQVALDEQGNALVVWTAGDGTTFVQAAFRPTGGSFGAPQDLSDPNASEPQVVFGEQGDALVAWTRFVAKVGQIETATRPAGGAFSAPEVISDTGGGEQLSKFGPQVSIDENAAVVWTAQPAFGFLRVQSAFRPRGGAFAKPQTVSDRALHGFEPDVAVDERGNAFALWTATDALDPELPSFSTVEFAYRPKM